MKTIPKTVLFLLMAICLTSCAPKEVVQTHFPQEIKSVYFQKANAGKEKPVQEIHFYIEFRKALSKELKLEKIYFRNQLGQVLKMSPTLYKAIFLQKPLPKDLILDSNPIKEYGNEAPAMAKPKFDLKPDQAVLEYKSNDSLRYFKLTRVKEREIISYP